MSEVRVRFAPSPTGPLHIGGVRTALFNYLFAKHHDGVNILRIEDTDQTRFVPGAEEYIVESLKWLGIEFQEGVHVGGDYGPYKQSERKAGYRQYAEQLVESDHAYYAFDTSEELEQMREKLKASKMQAQYDAVSRMSMKNSLTLSEDEVKNRIDSGEPYVIRIKLPRKEEVRFHDEIRGWVVVHTSQMDDKVLFKSDGMPTYHLANVVDDYNMKISHVIRGEEWLPSAPLHVMLYRYLGWEESMPKFAHLPLILKPEGNGKLSKRDGDRLGFPVFPLNWKDPKTGDESSGYRESGYEAEAVVNLLAMLGWHPSDNRELFTIDELIKEFTLDRVSKSGAKFDKEKALWFNHQYLMAKTGAELADEIGEIITAEFGEQDRSYVEAVCEMMKEKVQFSTEIPVKGGYFFGLPKAYHEKTVRKKWKGDAPSVLIELASRVSKGENWSATEFEEAFKALAEEKEMGAGALMQPLRLAVSGEAGGPPIFDMLALMGNKSVAERINVAVEKIKLPSAE
jgi:glutamyl-tRNA synthetase